MNKQYVKGESYFIRTNAPGTQYPYLREDLHCDVLIVGGGVTGAIAGYYFAKAGIDTVLIDKARIAHGSTAITTSLLQYELDDDAATLQGILGEEDTVLAYRLGQFALAELKAFIEAHGNHCRHKVVDSYYYTAKRQSKPQIEAEYQFRKKHGFDVSYVDGRAIVPECKAAVCAKGGAAVLDPYLYTHQLLGAAQGLRVYENTEAVGIRYEEDSVVVETVYGHTITCQKLIAATGYHTELFSKRRFATKYTTCNLVTEPLGEMDRVLKTSVLRDNEDPYHYLRATEDGRLILGGEDIVFDAQFREDGQILESYEKLEQMLHRITGEKVAISHRYCGAFATTKDNLGYIGRDPKHRNLWYSLGYGANGILFAILGGHYLSRLYGGDRDPAMRLFRVDRFD